MDVLEKLGEVVAEKARAKCPVGTKSRPVYKSGPYAGEEWTKRDAGALRRSIRVVRKYGDPEMNVWVMAGNKVTYYAAIVEHYTPFLKPAMRGIRAEAKRIFEGRSIGYRMRE